MPAETVDAAPRGYAKGRARREAIIAAATELYGEVGYRAASLREVAARAGLSHPGVLHHFPTKEALLLAVLENRDAEDLTRYGLGGLHGAAVLRQLVELAAGNALRPGIVELFVVLSAEATAPDHPAHAFFRERYETTRRLITEALDEVEAAGRLVPGVHAGDAVRRIVALMDGLQVQWLYDRTGTDMPAGLRAELLALVPDLYDEGA